MTPSLTVVVCTHNPRKDYLERVLAALKNQSLPSHKWELLLIDNASDSAVCDEFNLDWHPAGRCIPEPELGLTHARIRGICEARADVLVFVDDDNVLDADYLENAFQISDKYPSIGAWGGQIRGEYEIEPPEWSKAYLPYLGIREFTKEKWSNLLHQHETTPCGVGLCVRKSVADQYVKLVATDPRRALLDRVGSRLTSCEDTDLAFTACDLGLGTGQFPALRATRLIPSSRLEALYLRFVTPSLTVIICTHNPRKDYLERVLAALKNQSLPSHKWELLLIDNASDSTVCDKFDLSWHPAGRCIPEPELGLTHARIRGICEARADVLVFVDDDNVLDFDYLENVCQISEKYPLIGAWGGQIGGGYEIEPPEWSKAYLPYLGIREFTQEKWSNLLHQHETTPCGVGLCVRKSVADQYVKLVATDPKRALLGRVGSRLTSCEDTDLAFTACDLGLGTGQFPALRATHLIPSSRLEEDYLIRLCEGISYSHAILDSFRNKKSQITQRDDLLNEYDQSIMPFVEHRRIHQALIHGKQRAIQEMDEPAVDSE